MILGERSVLILIKLSAAFHTMDDISLRGNVLSLLSALQQHLDFYVFAGEDKYCTVHMRTGVPHTGYATGFKYLLVFTAEQSYSLYLKGTVQYVILSRMIPKLIPFRKRGRS